MKSKSLMRMQQRRRRCDAAKQRDEEDNGSFHLRRTFMGLSEVRAPRRAAPSLRPFVQPRKNCPLYSIIIF